ncbi:hypothetical protein NQ315_017328 [Exocentrus adspersus]|uniref:Uncharacterized protein n=1 Tax=Exocentrus adspersus TaxID=1586481 RepID=A0AAV8VDD4_9CUCU|nr:hypothetical protein NQ315_017328 [Exocentrus adspersus]
MVSCAQRSCNNRDGVDKKKLTGITFHSDSLGFYINGKIEGKETSAWQEISNRSPTFKGYWALWNSLAIENNLLKSLGVMTKERNNQTVPPWKRVPEVLRAVHSVHESTEKTPASVVFGAELRLPIDLISEQPKEEEDVDNYLSHLQDRLKLTHT